MFVFLLSAVLFSAVQCQIDFSGRARNFSIELLHYTQLETDGHVVISPFGVWTLMTGVTLGATGDSRSQLMRAFLLTKNPATLIQGYKALTKEVLDPTTTGVTLASRNFMFLDNGFSIKPDFRKSITTDFGAMIEILNFKDPKAAAIGANKIIEGSGASVSNVLKSDDFTESRMILTNVITFKGLWTTPFNESDTTVEPFYDENKNEIGKVKMMFLKAPVAYSNIKEMKSLVLELPYGSDAKYCMLIVLPYPKIKASEVYQKLALTSFPEIFARLQRDIDTFGLDEVNVKLPRFKISTNVVMNKPLNNMGVHDIFDPKVASFKSVTTEDLYVSAIIHKADIEVTESGTVASASTSAYFADRISTPNYHANRPFVYFVMHKPSATVIFSGIYSKPSVY